MFNGTLEDAISSDTSDHFKDFLLALLKRPKQTGKPDDKAAAADAKELREELIKGGKSSHEHTIKLFSSRSHEQLRLIFDVYKTQFKIEIEEDIKSSLSGDMENAYLAVVDASRNEQKYFAKRFQHSLDGAGTDDKTLIRLVVSRCEIDLETIKDEFESLTGKTLVAAVSSDTSGDYQKALISLIEGNNDGEHDKKPVAAGSTKKPDAKAKKGKVLKKLFVNFFCFRWGLFKF